MIRGVLGLAAVLALVPTPTRSGGEGIPVPSYDAGQIVEVESHPVTLGGRRYVATTYRNDAYACGRVGAFPFVVAEPVGSSGGRRPLWVLLHGGGIGHYDDARYVTVGGDESANDAEDAGQLLGMLYDYAGVDEDADTFVADRVAAGDRFVLGSLCDHDLYLGLGQPYPDNPNHADSVDGLLANLAMVDAVTNGTATVLRRPTASLWVLGTSAGAFGAYALAHNLGARGTDVDGLVLDAGLLVGRAVGLPGNEWVTDQAMIAKHGPYLADPALWIDRAIASGFDVAVFDTVQDGDALCRGTSDDDGCAWLHDGLAEAIAGGGDAATQQVRVYPGSVHMATRRPGTAVQDDLRAWYRSVTTS